MPVKHCCYGDCNSDSRFFWKRPEMEGITFIPFPKPKTQLQKCERWVRLCGRKYFTVSSIRKDTYICSKHFVGGNGPTEEYPDPLPAVSTEFERRLLSSKRKRKPPNDRCSPIAKKRQRKRLINDEQNTTEDVLYIATPLEPDFNYRSVEDHTYSSLNQRDQSTDFDFEAQNQDCRNIVTSSGIDGSDISDGEFCPESHLIGKYDKLIALGKGIISC